VQRKVAHACGKIIVSGNTSNAFGKRALAVPVNMHITVTWDKSEKPQEGLRIVWAGQREDGVWLTTAQKISKLIEARVGPLSGKLTIHNTLPLGKGMGSSTAIVVALARCFLGENCKDEALAIEDIINRGHSGIDFAAIWEERPIVITRDTYEFTDLPKGLQHGFLIDTGLPAEPTSIIIRRLKERVPREKILMDSIATIGNCTERLLSGEDPLTVLPDHHRGQVSLGVVPPRVRSLIEKIEQSGGAAKAARPGGGSGGVGMVFAVHPKVKVLKRVLRSAPLSITYDPLLRRFSSRAALLSTPKGEPARSVPQKANIFPHYSDESNREAEDIKRVPADDLGKFTDFNRERAKNRTSHSLRGTAGAEPVFSSELLIAYKYDPGLARHEEVAVTVKTTLQVHKNDRQEEHMKRPSAEVFGREATRRYVLGVVAAFSLAHDRFDWSLAESKWAFSALEPYAVDVWGDKMALSGGNYVSLIDIDTGKATPCQHAWLRQTHTVQFSADGTRLLVASAGFDAAFEFDTTTGEVVWEWFAWDHGFDRSKLGHYVVRSAARCKTLAAMGHEVLLVGDPEKYPFGIPTRQKPAHLNSACYDSDGKILVTLFHQGAGYVVDRNTGEARQVISGLINPHKLSRRKRGGYFISDTRRGKLIFLDEKHRPKYEVALTGTPGGVRSPQLSEYLQNATELRDDLFACIDIHRSSLWLIDVKRRKYRGIKFPVEWSMHDVASLEPEHLFRIGRLVGSAFGKVAAFAREIKVIHHFSPEGREITTLALDAHGRNRGLDVQM